MTGMAAPSKSEKIVTQAVALQWAATVDVVDLVEDMACVAASAAAEGALVAVEGMAVGLVVVEAMEAEEVTGLVEVVVSGAAGLRLKSKQLRILSPTSQPREGREARRSTSEM